MNSPHVTRIRDLQNLATFSPLIHKIMANSYLHQCHFTTTLNNQKCFM